MAEQARNVAKVNEGFHILLKVLAPYVSRELMSDYGAKWWQNAVLARLYPEQRRGLPQDGETEKLINSLDIKRCLVLVNAFWGEIFRDRLPNDNRTWANELNSVRDRVSHIGSEDISADDAWRALDTMARFGEALDAETAKELRRLAREGVASAHESASDEAGARDEAASRAGALPSWRDIIEPHPDVAQGRYRNAEFAADLAQVARGEGSAEYLDPVEFFARTYVTEGMKGLIGEALRRVSGKGGEPVIQLKTAFGGGKTHSMLALYHLLSRDAPIEKIPAAREIIRESGVSELPPTSAAVLVGTALDPATARIPEDMPDIAIHTLWGELAYQLAKSAGKPELFDIVREADKKGVSPGSIALTKLLDGAGSCLILMDELVAYARKIYEGKGLPAGSFENFITFVQEISEAARASKSSVVVASIPESDNEIGGEAGRKALAAIEHTFGRMELVWKPVASGEGFEVVRRRLFLDCKDEAARDKVCAQFAELYRTSASDFPIDVKDAAYRKRLVSCYPIHPEVFDRLYEDWATLERFQRTRGALRLMAAVIHELWMAKDQSPIISPGDIPLDKPSVRDELTRYLGDNWNAIVDSEVDGERSTPFQLDREHPRYGKLSASRRLTRAIMLGSAPSTREQDARGIEASRVRLGTVHPGEQISVFNDAMNALRNKLAFLYSNQSGDRYWYDSRPTLRKTVEDRASRIPSSDVEREIEDRLKRNCKKVAPLAGVHVCPGSSIDVPDEQTARLVVLRPRDAWEPNKPDCAAILSAAKILETRGDAPRKYKNTLVFLAPDKGILRGLEEETRRYLAWESVNDEKEELNLDQVQIREAANSLNRSSETIDMRLLDAWRVSLLPAEEREAPGIIEWRTSRVSAADNLKEIINPVARKLESEETVIANWSAAALLMELNDLLWRERDYLSVNDLWTYLTSYLYLPRLERFSTLAGAIRDGVLKAEDYFAYAAGMVDDKFIDLRYNEDASVEKSGYIVKSALARELIEAREAAKERKREDERETRLPGTENGGGQGGVAEAPPTIRDEGAKPAPARAKRFFLSAPIDPVRVNRDVSKIMDEILNHLISEGKLEITIEAKAVSEEGFDPEVERAVTENCGALKIREFGFERR